MINTWTIGGSDSSGCAGIQADLKTFHSLGVHGCSVITAITAQGVNTMEASYVIPAAFIQTQISSLLASLPPKAIKIGMLGHSNTIRELAIFLRDYHGPVILDPVFFSSSGKPLFSENFSNYLSELKTLFPSVDVLTPNILEAEQILGKPIQSHQDIKQAAQDILSLKVKSVLIKGGHSPHPNPPPQNGGRKIFNPLLPLEWGERFCQDYWTNGKDSFWLASPRYPQANYRGTGCTLASAIAACLSLGYTMKDAIVIAKMVINQAIRLARQNQSEKILAYTSWPEQEEDLPYLMTLPIANIPVAFPDCGTEPLGLYPIVDSLAWIEKLLPLGVTTVQLRIKNKKGKELEEEIQQAIQITKKYHARLFINDYWELAIRYGAYGVHLGQEDLDSADIEKIHQAGLRLGISTHCYYEVARAHAYRPSYIACGPIFPTTSKQMPFAPQGIHHLQRWRRTLNYPLVAIGGINLDNIAEVIATQVDGVAMISAIPVMFQINNPCLT